MSNYRRDFQGNTYFFTVVLQDRRQDWLVRHICEFRDAFRETMIHAPCETVAITILPEHFHWIMALPENDTDYPRRIRLLKTNFSKRIPPYYRHPTASQTRKGESGIWQRRYWEHRIRHEEDLMRHIHYTYYNPVKHGYVRQVADWPHSSFHRDVKDGLFTPDWGGEIEQKTLELYDE